MNSKPGLATTLLALACAAHAAPSLEQRAAAARATAEGAADCMTSVCASSRSTVRR